jgi:hypothetical protein
MKPEAKKNEERYKLVTNIVIWASGEIFEINI